MSRYWLTYNQGRRLLGVVIMDSTSLIQARMAAAVTRIDQGAKFVEGHWIDVMAVAMMPATAIGRMLSPEEAGKLIRRIERDIPKRPIAPPVKRRAVPGRNRA